jgi:hypothetical protein
MQYCCKFGLTLLLLYDFASTFAMPCCHFFWQPFQTSFSPCYFAGTCARLFRQLFGDPSKPYFRHPFSPALSPRHFASVLAES